MALKNGVFYWLECDECGEAFDNSYEGYTVMEESPNELLANAADAAWLVEHERHLCPNCAGRLEEELEGAEEEHAE